MIEEFQAYIDDFVDRRLNDSVVHLIHHDEIYKKMQDESRTVQHNLLSKADEETQELFVKYEDVMNAQMSIRLRQIYRIGFKDAIKIIGSIEKAK